MAEQLSLTSMLDQTNQLPIDWDALPTAYGLLRKFEITGPMLTVAVVTLADESGEEHFWRGMYEIGLDATKDQPDLYAVSVEYDDRPDSGCVTLQPYLPDTHRAFIAIAAMLEESDEIVGLQPDEDRSEMTPPDWYTEMVIAYKEGVGKVNQAYLEMAHPQLMGQLEGLGIFDKVIDVEFISRAKFGARNSTDENH